MELLPAIKNGQTSYIFNINLLDSASNTGGGKTGLTNATSGLLISTIADNEAAATVYTGNSTIQTIAAIGNYAAPSASNCRFIQVDSTNHPGLYQIQLADARYAVASAKVLYFCISGAAGLVPRHFAIPLLSDDPYVAKPSNSNLLSIDASGRTDLGAIVGDAAAAINLGKTTKAIGRGTADVGATTTSVPTSAFSPSAAESDQFKSRTILFDATTTTVGLRGVASTISASSNAANPTFTVPTLPAAPVSGDTFSVI
jgi:hypothetical protein